jgi:GT2 family glycosyltransferase
LSLSPKISVVILNWNGRKYLGQFLPSVLASDYSNFEVVVADNGSSDDSLSFLEHSYPQVRIIRLEKNLGFARGYNEALKQIQSDYYFILNSDVELLRDALIPLIDLLESDKSIAACQPKLLTYDNKKLFEYAGGAGGWLDKYGYPFAKGRIFDVFEEDHGQYDASEPIFWASGAALFIRSSVFHEVKGFDEYFFAHQEEIDLCWRIQLAGYKIYSCPASVVYHVGGGTLPKGNSLKVYLNFRNNMIMLSKNLPSRKAFFIIWFRIALNKISAMKGLLSGDFGYFKSIIRAHFGFFGWWFSHRKRNRPNYPKNKSLSGYYHGNVVWQHFVKKKKYFSEIVRK